MNATPAQHAHQSPTHISQDSSNAHAVSRSGSTFWRSPRWYVEVVALAAVSAAAVWLGDQFRGVNGVVAPWWPAAGVAFAGLWHLGLSRWPAIGFGSLVACGLQNVSVGAGVVVVIADCLQSVLAVWWVRRTIAGRDPLARVSDTAWFVALAVVFCPMLNALISSTALSLSAYPMLGPFEQLCLVRWLAQAIGVLVVAPVGLAWWPWRKQTLGLRQWLEHVAFLLFLTGSGVWVFVLQSKTSNLLIPASAVIFPVYIWLLLRGGRRVTTLTILALTLISLFAASQGRGPFLSDESLFLHDGRELISWGLLLKLRNSGFVSTTMLLMMALLTERREADLDTRKSNVRYRILFEHSPDAIFVVGVDSGELLEFNDRLPELLGGSREELRRRQRFDFEAVPIAMTTRSSVWSVLNPKATEVDTQYRRFDGQLIEVNVAYSVIDYDHRPAYLMIARDVTARRREEQQLRESEAKFRTLAETIPAIVAIQRDHQMLYANPAAATLSGFTSDELLQHDFVKLVRPDYQPETEHQIRQCLAKDKQIWRREVSLRTRAGKDHWIDLSVAPISIEGRLAWLATALDVTERRQTEAQVRQLHAELFHVSRLRLLGEFVAGVAHEIGQPLASIGSVATGLATRLESAESPSQTHVLEQVRLISSVCDRAGETIHRLKNFARRHEMGREWIDLAPLVSDAVKILRLDRRWTDTPIVFAPEPRRPQAFVDRHEMTDVLINLLRNSLESMQELPAEDHRIDVQLCRDRPGWLRLSIRDQGCGLSPEICDQLFRPFQTTKPQGLGIGLSICKTIVDAHDGQLVYEPTPLRGALFHILLRSDELESLTSGDPVTMHANP